MTIGELKRMLERFSNDKEVVLHHVSTEYDSEDYDVTVFEGKMELVAVYGKYFCIIELEDC